MIPGPGSTSKGPFEVVRSGSSRAAYRCPGAAQSGDVRVARGVIGSAKILEKWLESSKTSDIYYYLLIY